MSWCFGLFWFVLGFLWDLLVRFVIVIVATAIAVTTAIVIAAAAVVAVFLFREGCFQYLLFCCREPKPVLALQHVGAHAQMGGEIGFD